jgi:hypothetical protein
MRRAFAWLAAACHPAPGAQIRQRSGKPLIITNSAPPDNAEAMPRDGSAETGTDPACG